MPEGGGTINRRKASTKAARRGTRRPYAHAASPAIIATNDSACNRTLAFLYPRQSRITAMPRIVSALALGQRREPRKACRSLNASTNARTGTRATWPAYGFLIDSDVRFLKNGL